MKTGFGIFLKKYRLANHLSQSEFAELLEISDSTLASLERGSRKPSYDMLISIIKKLRQEKSFFPENPKRVKMQLNYWVKRSLRKIEKDFSEKKMLFSI